MDTELLLFLLRLVSGALLLAFLALVIVILWRDYHGAEQESSANRRSYGLLLVVRQFEGAYLLTSETYPLFPLTTLGRAPTNTITIQDTFASNEHALIALRNSQWWLEDRKSRNGTLLNGMAVIQPIIVTDGDVISIGNMSFKLQIER
jgi:hypothetical protein